MRRIAFFLLLALMIVAAPGVRAEGAPKLLDMVPLLPLSDGAHPDIDDLMGRAWRGYYKVDSEFGFGPAALRAGRIDLDGDGAEELVVMIDLPKWRAADGQPFVVAAWQGGGWQPVGWGWADDDGIFVTDEVRDGWRTLDAGNYLLRWTREGYARDRKPQAPGLSAPE